MQYGTTYIVRPRMQPSNSASILRCASAGSIQLLFGPASSSLARADERQVLDARDVGRIRAVQVAVRERRLVEFDQVAVRKHELRSAGRAPRRSPCTIAIRSGWVSLAVSATQSLRAVLRCRHRPGSLGGAACAGAVGHRGALRRPTDYSVHDVRRCGAPGEPVVHGQKKAPSGEGAIRGRPVYQTSDDLLGLALSRARVGTLRAPRRVLRRAAFARLGGVRPGASSAASRRCSRRHAVATPRMSRPASLKIVTARLASSTMRARVAGVSSIWSRTRSTTLAARVARSRRSAHRPSAARS